MAAPQERSAGCLARSACGDGLLGIRSCIGPADHGPALGGSLGQRSEEHTSELQSLMRISYAVFCLKKKKQENVKKTLQIQSRNRQSMISMHQRYVYISVI